MTDSISPSQVTADPSAVDHETTRRLHSQDTNTAMTHTTHRGQAVKTRDQYAFEQGDHEAPREGSMAAATTGDTPTATSYPTTTTTTTIIIVVHHDTRLATRSPNLSSRKAVDTETSSEKKTRGCTMRCASVTTVIERRIRIRIIMDIIQEPRGQPRGRDRELGLAMMIIIGELMEGPWVGVEDTIGMDIDDLALVFF